eukprot:CAMPEP_0181309596 /NCGR_PEP_ID=MMETSP1101-20121128/12097_1 /TAXON_ID=46948 /ORGANISM="Rhodomonas abbreviata, Strain Caron Lab Isolate" /LENGTH=410 /DNA_ID=CAMNT_0023416089 /DNA_START=169 /DNA_END=1397 /DNA_ORIENTATION=+
MGSLPKISWADLASDDGMTPSNSPQQNALQNSRASEEEPASDIHTHHLKDDNSMAAENQQSRLDTAMEKLEQLFHTRDSLFNLDPAERKEKLLLQQSDLIKFLDNLGESKTTQQRALVHYIRGKALDVEDDHVPKAEEELSKAVKLDSSMGDAWNQLGMSFWKKGDVQTAHDCWQSTLIHCISLQHTKAAMRELSMAYRARGGDAGESLRLAKELISKDMSDHKSWSNLGNAYMSFFFASSLDREDLFRALKAYHRSDACVDSQDPDLYYNKATVYRYLEDYQSAILEFNRAAELDPNLQAAEAIKEVESLVGEMTWMIEQHCNLKPPRIHAMLATLPAMPEPLVVSAAEFRNVGCPQLKEGANVGKAVTGLVLATPKADGPIRLVVAERGGELSCVSVYNMKGGRVKPG